MKRLLAFTTFILSTVFSTFAYDFHTNFAASLGFGSENGKINNVSTNSTLKNFGIYAGAGIFPDYSFVGFHFDIDLHLLNGISSMESDLESFSKGSSADVNKSFAFAYQIGLGPSFKRESEDILLQFTPELGFAFEMENGKISYKSYSKYTIDYSYIGLLFGFGGDLSFVSSPMSKWSFVLGTHFAYYPVYAPSVKIDNKSYDIELESYSRFMLNIYLGVQIHQRH